MTNVGPTCWYVDYGDGATTGYYAVTKWSAGASISAGNLIRQKTTPATTSERVFVALNSGTTGGAEPTWIVSNMGSKTSDNGITWQDCTGQPGVNGDTASSPTWLQNKNNSVTLGLIIYDSGTSSLQIVSTAGTTGNGSAPSFNGTAGTTTADNTVTWTSLGLASTFTKWNAPHARLNGPFANGLFARAGDTIYVASEHNETTTDNNGSSIIPPGTTAAPTLIISVNKSGSTPPVPGDYMPGATITGTGVTLGYNGEAFVSAGIYYATNDRFIMQGQNVFNATHHLKDGKITLLSGADWFLTGTNGGAVVTLENTPISFASAGQGILLQFVNFQWFNTPNAVQGTAPTTLILFNAQSQGASVFGCDLSALGSGHNLVRPGATLQCPVVFSNCKLGSSVNIWDSGNPWTNPFGSVSLINCDSGATGYRNEYHGYYGDLTTETTITLSTASGGASTSIQKYSWKIVTNSNVSSLTPFISPPIAIYNKTLGTSMNGKLEIISSFTANNNDIWIQIEYLGTSGFPVSSFANDGLSTALSTAAAQTSSTATWDNSPATPVKQIIDTSFTPQLAGYVYARIYIGKPSATVYVNPLLQIT